VIDVQDLHTYRGINYVLQGVSLRIGDGACTVLLGRNGMGKTTLVHTIMGLIRPRSGRITLAGDDLTGKQPFQIAQRGLALVPQGRRIFASLTRALLTNPRLLLMDEPSEGLAPVIVERISEVLADLRRGGLGIFLVEQNYGLATGAADVIYILSKGQVVWQGTAAELANAATVRETHLGV